MDARDILIRPIITEKSTDLISSHNRYSFIVDLRANRTEIKKAVEQIFKVKVDKVNTVRVRGKMRRQGQTQGKRPDFKKAYVTLADGHSIEVFEGL
jgi:large subunit ribosomal protein L23